MARFNQILILSAISLITLAGCDSAKEASTPQTSSSTEKVMTEFKKPQPSKDKVLAELDSLDKTIKTFPKS